MILRWPGGKYKLARRILPHIPGHRRYCEVFCGACHVFFKKPPAREEVLNDINDELINFWRQVSQDVSPLLQAGRYALYSRAEFRRMLGESGGNPAEAAWRFFYLNRVGFGGKLQNQTFGTDCRNARTFARCVEKLELCHERLKHVLIENLDWEECLARHDGKETFFYLDPPYAGFEDDYGPGLFGPDDFARLAQRLAKLQGNFLLSINDTPAMRQTFAEFAILEEFRLEYSLNREHGRPARELLIGKLPANAH